MKNNRINMNYRDVQIIAAFYNGEFQARGFRKDKCAFSVNKCFSIDDAVEKIKCQIDQFLSSKPQPTQSFNSMAVSSDAVYTRTIYVAGITHLNKNGTSRQSILGSISLDEKLFLSPEPYNPHDSNAIMVSTSRGQIGYIPRDLAAYLKGKKLIAGSIRSLQRLPDGNIGCQIVISFSETALQPMYSYSFQPYLHTVLASNLDDLDNNNNEKEDMEYDDVDYGNEYEECYHSEYYDEGPDGESLEDCSPDMGYAEELDWENRF